jgi:branched-subunit amino acid transport protein
VSASVLVLLAALVTVGSRIAALALLPPPSGPLAGLVARLPAPLFAALAALSLTQASAGSRDPALLAALGCAALAARWRSLLLVLAAGLAGYLLVTVVR